MRIRSRVLAAIVATTLVSVGAIAPSIASAEEPEEPSGLTLSYSESGSIMVTVGDAAFLSGLNMIPKNSRQISVEYSYIDPSGPWNIHHAPVSGRDAGSFGQSTPLPAEFELGANPPGPTTHMRVKIKNEHTGAELSSETIQVRKPYPDLRIAMHVNEWYSKGSYIQFRVQIDSDSRRGLPGMVCEFGCSKELWGVYPSGEKYLIKR